MPDHYTDGPTDQLWEARVDDTLIYVQRRGWSDRQIRGNHTETFYTFDGGIESAKATHLAARLNRLDALAGALLALADAIKTPTDSLYRYHLIGYERGTDYGLCPEDNECVRCTAIRQLRAAEQAAREVLG